MSRLQTFEVKEAAGKVKRILESFQSSIGTIPNIFKGMAISTSLPHATVTLDRLIGEGTLTGVEQVAVKLTVAQYYGCEYCLAVCTASGRGEGCLRSRC